MADGPRQPKYRDAENLDRLRELSDELQTYEAEIRAFFNLAPDLFCTISWDVGDLPKDQMFDRVNPAWKDVLGYSVEQLTSEPYLDKIYEEDRGTEEELNTPNVDMTHDQLVAAIKDAEAKGIKFDLERSPMLDAYIQRWYHADGSIKYISWKATFDFRARKAYAIGRDITDLATTNPESILKVKHGLITVATSELDEIINIAAHAKERISRVADVIAEEIKEQK